MLFLYLSSPVVNGLFLRPVLELKLVRIGGREREREAVFSERREKHEDDQEPDTRKKYKLTNYACTFWTILSLESCTVEYLIFE